MKLTIRVPFQPKDSGKYFHGSFNVLFLEFSDRLPAWLNNLLWRIHDLPGIHLLSIFCARGGVKRCFRCTRLMWPWQTLQSDGNVYERIFPTMDHHVECDVAPTSDLAKVRFIEQHLVRTFYQPDWFVKEALDDSWERIIEAIDDRRVRDRARKFALHELVKAALKL